jgi:hypothetical protein
MGYTFTEITQNETHLPYLLGHGDTERHGAIGYLRGDFGRDGSEFWTSFFDIQPHLKNPAFRKEFNGMVTFLREASLAPAEGADPFASRCLHDMRHPKGAVTQFKIQTEGFSYYARFPAGRAEYFYIFAYDNRFLLPELAGQHQLPHKCFSIHPETGKTILIWKERGFDAFDRAESGAELRRAVKRDNAPWNITPQQEAAMLGGALHGWDSPEAKPWNYDKDGKLRALPMPKGKHEPEVP